MYRYYLGSQLDRDRVQAKVDDATNELVGLLISQPLYVMNELQRLKLTNYATAGSDIFEVLARLDIQIDSDLEQIYLDSITP